MSAPSLADHVAHLTADPVLADHPVAAVVRKLVDQLGVLEAENAELRHQLGRHSGNSGQPPRRTVPRHRRARAAGVSRGAAGWAAGQAMRGRPGAKWQRHRLMSVSTTGRRGKAVAG